MRQAQPTDMASNGMISQLASQFKTEGDGVRNYLVDRKVSYMWRPGDSKQARFESHCCSRVLSREK